MDFLEKDLEEIVFNASNEELMKCGLWVNGKRFRQLKIGKYGVADMVTAKIQPTEHKRKFIDITIYELKKEKINVDTFLQCLRYAKGIIQYIEQRSNIAVHTNIVMIGKKIDLSSSLIYLTDLIYYDYSVFPSTGLKQILFYTYKYNIDGLRFVHESNYSLTNEGFKL